MSLNSTRIRFVEDWRCYKRNDEIDVVSCGLGKGPAQALVDRGSAEWIESNEPVEQAVSNVQRRRGRPPKQQGYVE